MDTSVFSENSFETDVPILYYGFNPVNLFDTKTVPKRARILEPLHVFPNGEPPVRRQRFISNLTQFLQKILFFTLFYDFLPSD
jgi:hypothetical protein